VKISGCGAHRRASLCQKVADKAAKKAAENFKKN
jgi:hypothetical protein